MKLLVVHALVISLRLVQGKIDDASKEALPGRFHEGIEDVEEKDLGETGATKPWDGEKWSALRGVASQVEGGEAFSLDLNEHQIGGGNLGKAFKKLYDENMHSLRSTEKDDEDVVRLTHIKKLLEAVEKTSINDRREFLEVLGEMFQKGVKDLSAFREEIKQHDMPFLAPLFDLDDEYAKKTLAIFDILIDLFKSVEAEDESTANDLVVVPEKKRRKLRFGDFEARNEEAGKTYKRRVLESNTSHGFPFVPVSRFFVKQHSTSGFHHRLGQFRGALNGNPRGNGFIGNSKTSPGELRRRLNGDPATHCLVLAVCADGLSLYDYVLYIMSDDIDQATGAIDSSVISFDEHNIESKLKAIKFKAKRIMSEEHPVAPAMHESCAPLLQEFHRTVEVDGVPEWQPGLVSSVCLAEGTTQFIKLGEIAAALLVEKLVPSWPMVHPANYVPKRDGSACTGSFGTCAVAITNSRDGGWRGGWYDVDRCGSCNHYCRWVGNSGDGGDPSVTTTYGESFWACETADAVYIKHSTFKYQKCGSKEEKSTAEVFACPISSSNAANTNKFNHAVVIHGVNGCTVQADSIDAWADSNRLIFSITDKTSLQQVNDCLAPFTEFKVRSEPILKRTATTHVGVDKANGFFNMQLVVQPFIPSGYDKPLIIHGDGCNLRSNGIKDWVRTNGYMYIYSEDIDTLTAAAINECLPPGKSFTISVVDTSIESDTTQLAEALVGELLQCAEDLFYTGTNFLENRVDPAGWVGTRNGGACKQQTHENYLPFGYRFWCPLVSQTALNEGRNGKVLIHGANGCTLKAYKISYWAYLYNGSSRFYFVPDVEYTLDEVNACLRPNEDFHVYEAAESFVFGGCGTGTSWVKRPPAQGNSCEKQSLLSVPQDKCLQAGLSVGGIRDTSDSSYNIDGVRTHYYENMPSGCFIFTTDNIVNWNTKGIGGNDARGEMVCEDPFCPLSSYKFPVGISEENGRDVHGQLTSSGSGFVFKSYTEIQSEFSHCLSGFEDDADEQHEMTLECVKDTFYGQLEYGIQLVFGAQTSPGFVCGILESVKHQNKTLPGSCCLDAPYELSGDQWGHAYDCKSTCQRPGPYFGGLDEAACAAQGGTFCRNADDCSTLKDCVADNIIDAQNMDLFAYEQYLNASSSISDCGKLRNYFGFDEFFINEEAICEDVDQLKYSKDFDFLNEFFGQGSAGGSGGGDPTDIPPAPPELEVPQMAEFDVLDEVDTTVSTSEVVLNGGDWEATNHASENALKIVRAIAESVKDFECLEDFSGAVKTACAIIKNIAHAILQAIIFPIELAYEISEFTREDTTEVDNIQPIETWETTQAIYGNMMNTGAYMQVGFQEVLNFIGKANQEVLDYVHATHGGRKLLLEGTDKDLELDFDSEIVQAIAAHSNSGLQEMKEELQEMKEELQEMKEELQDRFDAKFDELNAKFDAGTMDLMIQVVKKQDPTTLMIVTTFRGMPVQADIEIVGFDEGTEEDVSISFESKQLGNGKVLLKLKESSAKFLTIKALYRGVDNHSKDQQGGLVLESSELVSILGW